DHLGDLADEPTGGNDGIAAAQVLDQFLVFLRALLLRAQDQKIHDDEDQNERQQGLPPVATAEWARLGKSGRHEHLLVLCACGLAGFCPRASRRRRHIDRRTKSARTIAGSHPIATLVCPENPADSAIRHGDLAALPAPRQGCAAADRPPWPNAFASPRPRRASGYPWKPTRKAHSSASRKRSSALHPARRKRPASQRLMLFRGIRTCGGSHRSRTSIASRCRCSRASTACATCCSRTPSASRADCRPTTRCCGAR